MSSIVYYHFPILKNHWKSEISAFGKVVESQKKKCRLVGIGLWVQRYKISLFKCILYIYIYINRHPITKEAFQYFEKSNQYKQSFYERYRELAESLLPDLAEDTSLLLVDSLIENTFQSRINTNNDVDKINEIEILIRFYNRNNIGLLNAALTPRVEMNEQHWDVILYIYFISKIFSFCKLSIL